VDTTEIPKGWWLNVTIMANKYEPEWIVGVLREGKSVWITEGAKGGFSNSSDAYLYGMDFIQRYRDKYENKSK
jgi:hypothetical protein